MLLTRCPDLCELKIDALPFAGEYNRCLDIRRVAGGRWPNLRRLTLGDFVLLYEFSEHPSAESLFMPFLAAHSNLETLVLHPVQGRYFPRRLALPPSTLPHLDFFSGTVTHLKGLPSFSSVKNLQLISHPHGPYRLPSVYDILPKFTSLLSLSIWIDNVEFPQNPNPIRDDHRLFHSLFSSCPQISHIEIMCSSDPPLNIVSFNDLIIRTDSIFATSYPTPKICQCSRLETLLGCALPRAAASVIYPYEISQIQRRGHDPKRVTDYSREP